MFATPLNRRHVVSKPKKRPAPQNENLLGGLAEQFAKLEYKQRKLQQSQCKLQHQITMHISETKNHNAHCQRH